MKKSFFVVIILVCALRGSFAHANNYKTLSTVLDRQLIQWKTFHAQLTDEKSKTSSSAIAELIQDYVDRSKNVVNGLEAEKRNYPEGIRSKTLLDEQKVLRMTRVYKVLIYEKVKEIFRYDSDIRPLLESELRSRFESLDRLKKSLEAVEKTLKEVGKNDSTVGAQSEPNASVVAEYLFKQDRSLFEQIYQFENLDQNLRDSFSHRWFKMTQDAIEDLGNNHLVSPAYMSQTCKKFTQILSHPFFKERVEELKHFKEVYFPNIASIRDTGQKYCQLKSSSCQCCKMEMGDLKRLTDLNVGALIRKRNEIRTRQREERLAEKREARQATQESKRQKVAHSSRVIQKENHANFDSESKHSEVSRELYEEQRIAFEKESQMAAEEKRIREEREEALRLEIEKQNEEAKAQKERRKEEAALQASRTSGFSASDSSDESWVAASSSSFSSGGRSSNSGSDSSSRASSPKQVSVRVAATATFVRWYESLDCSDRKAIRVALKEVGELAALPGKGNKWRALGNGLFELKINTHTRVYFKLKLDKGMITEIFLLEGGSKNKQDRQIRKLVDIWEGESVEKLSKSSGVFLDFSSYLCTEDDDSDFDSSEESDTTISTSFSASQISPW